MQRNILRAIDRIDPARVRVEADLRPFGNSLGTLASFDPVRIPVSPDVDRAQFEAAVQAALAGLEVSVRVTPDLDGFDAAIRAHRAPSVTVDVDVDRGLSRALSGIGRALGGLGGAARSAVGIGAIGIAAASAAQSVLALGAALAPAAGAVAALPAVFLGAKAAMGVFQLATVGVGDAMSALASGDAKKLEEALKKLSPAAREAFTALQGLAPQFKAIQQSIQDSLFEKFNKDITAAGENLLPLQGRLQGIAGEFGRAASEALKFGASREAFNGLAAVLSGTKLSLSGLAAATQPVLKGILDVAAAVSVAFSGQVAGAISQTGASFGTWLSGLAASGRAVELVRGAAQVFSQLGDIASNVGQIISGVFSAANDVGGGLLNNLERVTGAFNEFVQSAQGQEAIGNIFRTLSTVAAQFAPILSAIVTTLGQISPALAPLFTTIGPAIAGLISALGPALAAIAPGLQELVGGLTGALAAISDSGAFEAIGEAIGAIAKAIAPLLPVIGELVGQFTAALAPALTAVANALTPVIQAIAGAFLPVIEPLAGVISTVVAALTPLVTIIGVTLANVIKALAPLLTTVADVFTQVAVALTPLIGQITAALLPAFASLTPIVTQLVAAIVPLVQQLVAALLPALPPLIDAFVAIQTAIIPLLPIGAQLVAALAPLVALLISALGPVIKFAAEIVKWAAINIVVPIIQKIIQILTSFADTMRVIISNVVGFARGVISGFQYLYNTVPKLVSSMVSAVVGFFKSLPGKALSAVSSVVGFMRGVFDDAKRAVLSAVTSLIGGAIGLIKELPGKAKSALSGIGSALLSAGGDLVQGLINGVKAKAGEVASAAKSVVKGAIDGAKSLLGIASPSKVFAAIGRFTGQGFINGLTRTAPAIRETSEKMFDLIRSAFEGKKGARLDDVLIRQVQATQTRLERLAAARDKIAERIKAANEFAASTTSAALSSFSLQNVAGQGNGGISAITNGLTAALNQVKRFNDQVNVLAKRGLRRDLLSQVIGLGPEQGSTIAATLAAASDRQLRELNDVQKQLSAASTKLGKDSADALFDAGSQASKGFLAGLKSQQKDIQDLMITIARASARAIRTALGIRSPSRVFAQIGRYTMAGLGVGIEQQMGSLSRTVAGAARAITEPFGGSVDVGSFRGSSGRQNGAQSRGGRAPATTAAAPVTINLNGTGYTDADARRVVNRIVQFAGL